MRTALQIFLALFVLFMAAVCLWLGATGWLDGAVEFPSRRQHPAVLQADSPRAYWACVALWLSLGVGFTALGIVNFRRAMRGER